MEEVTPIALFACGALLILAALVKADWDKFGLKFHLESAWQRIAVGALGGVFIFGSWLFHEHETKTPDCSVTGIATSSGANSLASVSGCTVKSEGEKKP